MRDNNLITQIFITLILLVIVVLIIIVAHDFEKLTKERDLLQEKVMLLEKENDFLQQKLQLLINEIKEQQNSLYQYMEQWLNEWEIQEAEITAYAPLDPRAKEGMCFSGDRAITASGALVKIGITAAAGPDVPFGTRVYVPGFGWRVVQDRGGRIGPGQLDVAVATKEEALAWGRRAVKVVYEKWR